MSFAGRVLSFLVFLTAVVFTAEVQKAHAEIVDGVYVREHKDQDGVVLVDVRKKEFYDGKVPGKGFVGGHIPGAISFPVERLKEEDAHEELEKAGITKDKTVIVYCNLGRQTRWFVDALIRDFGYDSVNVKEYRGSMFDWGRHYGNEVVTSADMK